MLPDGVLSTQAISSTILPPRDKSKIDLVDFEYGPIGISNPSAGMKYQVWTGKYSNGNIVYSSDNTPETVVYSTPNVNELSITFDQNGRPAFAFCDDNGSHLYWFNTLTNQYEVLDVGKFAYNPRVTLDDKREFNISNNDILFFYLLNNNLCVRYQRERFQTEHVLSNVGSKAILDNVGMNTVYRVQINVKEPA